MSQSEKAETGTIGATPPQFALGRVPARRLGNPGPLGLFSFASTTLILSFYNVNARGVTVPNVVVGMSLFVGGLAQLLAGMWEFACGNTFGATAFTLFGGFWGSFGSLYLPSLGIVAAYGTNATELHNAIGLYLMTWFVVVFILLIATLRRNLGMVVLFFFLSITFMLLAISELTGSTSVTKAGGGFGIITAFAAYYVGAAELLIRDESWFTLPLGQIPKRLD